MFLHLLFWLLWLHIADHICCFFFLDENPAAKNVILSAMLEWEQSSCLKFVRRTTEKNYIEFFKGGG